MRAAKQASRARRANDVAQHAWNVQPNSKGVSQWEHDGGRSRDLRTGSSSLVVQWERENQSRLRAFVERVGQQLRASTKLFVFLGFAFAFGFIVASGPDSAAANLRLRERLKSTNAGLAAREGELELARLELARLKAVMDNSTRYRIPADLAAAVYDIALAEGIDPNVGYSLVNVESEFWPRAVSPVGALGLTQVMPRTARYLQPGIKRSDLFDSETNLRLGFRYLREMIHKYDGDLDLALHAYNRGPTIVDNILRKGGDPSNGYADAVLRGAAKATPRKAE